MKLPFFNRMTADKTTATGIEVLADAVDAIRAHRDQHLAAVNDYDRIIADATERRRQHNVAYEALNETLFTMTTADIAQINVDDAPEDADAPLLSLGHTLYNLPAKDEAEYDIARKAC